MQYLRKQKLKEMVKTWENMFLNEERKDIIF